MNKNTLVTKKQSSIASNLLRFGFVLHRPLNVNRYMSGSFINTFADEGLSVFKFFPYSSVVTVNEEKSQFLLISCQAGQSSLGKRSIV